MKGQPQHRELHALHFSNSVWVLWRSTLNIKHRTYCETMPTVYSPYPRRFESLTICWCNCKGSTFSSVISRPWVMVRPESNSRPPASQSDAQPTESPVRGQPQQIILNALFRHWLIRDLFAHRLSLCLDTSMSITQIMNLLISVNAVHTWRYIKQ